MPLVSGTELGPYGILAAIGAGGAGDACRARGGKPKRDGAARVLPDEYSRDPDSVSGFPLNHSKIASVYEIEEASGSRLPVGGLVDGETLADRLKRRALPVRKPSSSQGRSAKRWKWRTRTTSFTATSSRRASPPTTA